VDIPTDYLKSPTSIENPRHRFNEFGEPINPTNRRGETPEPAKEPEFTVVQNRKGLFVFFHLLTFQGRHVVETGARSEAAKAKRKLAECQRIRANLPGVDDFTGDLHIYRILMPDIVEYNDYWLKYKTFCLCPICSPELQSDVRTHKNNNLISAEILGTL